jgi:2-iminobutanoate/2-iminopropanoate deaminase
VDFILTPDAPYPAGHYSQAVVHAGIVYAAGQLPHDPHNPDAPHGDIEEQTERTLRNVEAVLVAAGSGLDRVLQMTVYVTDVTLWPRVNATFARVMGDHRPARAVVPVPALNRGFMIEIQTIAAVNEP